MKVSEKMTRNVYIASPDDSIQQAARTMAECDAGALPVGQDDRLFGMVTDRDIAVRGVA
jgi:CBS domain-containing protein